VAVDEETLSGVEQPASQPASQPSLAPAMRGPRDPSGGPLIVALFRLHAPRVFGYDDSQEAASIVRVRAEHSFPQRE
jgi:hypothetical protein